MHICIGICVCFACFIYTSEICLLNFVILYLYMFSDFTPDQVQSHKAWKRAIMLVWRQIAQHKYANLFLQPVKDDDATGYSEVVHK